MRRADGPPAAFVAWAPVAGRSRDIAEALDGVAWCDYDERLRGWRAPLRYLRSTLRQARWLAATRPGSVIATNPPVFCGLGAIAHARAAGIPFVLDSHPLAFEDRRRWVTAVAGPVHRVLARHAAAVLVTTDDLAVEVASWGGHPIVLHEPPAGLHMEPRPPRRRALVAFVGTFASDEPVDEVIAAARMLPEVDVHVTGVLSRAPEGLADRAPANVHFTGWLERDEYRDLLRRASVVIALTTRPTSVMRAAYEAVYAGRSLIVSDTPVLRSLFTDAVFAENRAGSLAAAVRDVLGALHRFDGRAPLARSRQCERWEAQLSVLRDSLAAATPAAAVPVR